MHVARLANPKGLRGIKCGGRYKHGRETDQTVEGCYKLRHLRHRDTARCDGANRSADGDAGNDEPPCQRIC